MLLEDLGRNRRVWTTLVDQVDTMAPDDVIAWVAEQHQRDTKGVSAR